MTLTFKEHLAWLFQAHLYIPVNLNIVYSLPYDTMHSIQNDHSTDYEIHIIGLSFLKLVEMS